MDVTKLTVYDIVEKIKTKQLSAEALVLEYIKRIEEFKHKNAVLEVFDSAIQEAKKIDERIANGEKLGALAGVPIIIKDNILYDGHKMTCASKFLKDFVAPYTSTVVKKLLNQDAIILGRANMDEFAMGGSNENSAWGPCLNAFDDSKVAGGSSGGSAVAVALSLCGASLGTDTGGSVRQPASFNRVVGLKPTYGRVSRFGVSAFASSLDQVGPITKTVKDSALMLGVLAGADENDQTSLLDEVPNYIEQISGEVKGLKIGVLKQVKEMVKGGQHEQSLQNLIEFLKESGAEIVEFDYPYTEIVAPVYYILSSAEVSSNLGRIDGVKYSARASSAQEINQLYQESRSQGFGKEVKRRIMLGNFALSSANYKEYYEKARGLQAMLAEKTIKLFDSCDVVLLPTSLTEAADLGQASNTQDPADIYKQDWLTALANITQLPAISLPYANGDRGLPVGIQVVSRPLNEGVIFNVADFIEQEFCEVKK